MRMTSSGRCVTLLAALAGLLACSSLPDDGTRSGQAAVSQSDSLRPPPADTTDTTPVAKPVPAFDLTVLALATNAAADTTTGVPLPGATLVLSLVTGTDSGATSSPRTAITDANGQAVFSGVPMGTQYVLRATPPVGGAYLSAVFPFGPSPFSSTVNIKIYLPHTP